MDQAIVEQKGAASTSANSKPPLLPLGGQPPSRPGTRKEVFALDEGDVVLSYPESFSATSFEDLEAHLNVFPRKAKRPAGGETVSE